MSGIGKAIMSKIHLIGNETGIVADEMVQMGLMLHYQKSGDTYEDNPYWCGAHFDHGLFTALTPATYYTADRLIEEPEEAGLFVRVGGEFKRVVADPDILLFQVGEFGQLVLDDKIQATEHRVQKAKGSVERYALAVFFSLSLETTIRSTSILTEDSRYSGGAHDPCTFDHWNQESFKRYIVSE